jgi:hypothetical protein
MQQCKGSWGTCVCAAMADNDFGNAAQAGRSAGDAGTNSTLHVPPRDCNPGLYLGTYDCDVEFIPGLAFPLSGDVSFNLSIDETVVPGECDDEFCPDLVISENSGTLFGLAGTTGFEAKLEGALDCTSGVFQAKGVGGKWGNPISTDPNDPNALLTVEDPPQGMFDGMLAGMHMPGTPEAIAGTWNLADTLSGTTCNGPFHVELQP